MGGSSQAVNIKQAQIIVLALCGGCLMVMGIMAMQRSPLGEPLVAMPETGLPILTLVVLLSLPSMLGARLMILKATEAQFVELAAEEGAAALMKPFTTRMIIGSALLEGFVFFASIVYMIEGGWLPLLLALLVTVVLALQFPTQRKLDDWADRLKRRAREDASFR